MWACSVRFHLGRIQPERSKVVERRAAAAAAAAAMDADGGTSTREQQPGCPASSTEAA